MLPVVTGDVPTVQTASELNILELSLGTQWLPRPLIPRLLMLLSSRARFVKRDQDL